MSEKHLEKNCIADPNSDCDSCELNGQLICRFEKSFVCKFVITNTFYRIIAILNLIFAGIILNQMWIVYTYFVIVLLIFFIIEPRLLCTHCPYYEKEGKFLKCWALRGMPKLWKYRPQPITKVEKSSMLVIGMYIDLFPYVGIIWGIIGFFLQTPEERVASIFVICLIIVAIIFTILVYYFGMQLIGENCKKCPNFSCAMNKTPDSLKDKFLDKNPKMKKAWSD